MECYSTRLVEQHSKQIGKISLEIIYLIFLDILYQMNFYLLYKEGQEWKDARIYKRTISGLRAGIFGKSLDGILGEKVFF